MKNEETAVKCNLCPRKCNADRARGQIGYCGAGGMVTAARVSLHMWEEPCISGKGGSGTVFFSGCNLRCVFCQNREIATGEKGIEISTQRLAEIFLEQQSRGAENINLVTPGHFADKIKEALALAKEQGLALPVVYNTSSYELPETLRQMEGLVDIYLADFKYMSSERSARYSHAPDYAEYAKEALAEMVRQTGAPEFHDGTGMMQKGVIVRHLLMPGGLKDAKAVLRYLYRTYGNRIYFSIMNQYTPVNIPEEYREINRRVSDREYNDLIRYAISLGIENGYIQEDGAAEESFIPDFENFEDIRSPHSLL